MFGTQHGLLFDLVRGCFELRLERPVKFKTRFEIQLRSRILAAHQTHNSSIAIRLGILRIDLDRAAEIGECALDITFLRQQISAIVVEPRMWFECDGFTQICYRFVKPPSSIESNATEVEAVLELLAVEFDCFRKIGDSSIEIELLETADPAL